MSTKNFNSFSKAGFLLLEAILLFVASLALYRFYQVSPLDHHTLESILTLKFQGPYKSIFDYHHLTHSWKKPLHYFLGFNIFYLLNTTPFQAFISLALLEVTFFLVSIGIVLKRLTSNIFQFIFGFAIFLTIFKIFFINISILEDNISYYGFLLLGSYYFINCARSRRNTLLAGIFLGLASCFYTSQIIHVFTLFPVIGLAFLTKQKHLIKPVSQVSVLIIAIYHAVCQWLLYSQFHLDIFDIFKTVFTLNVDPRTKATVGGDIFSNVLTGFAKSFTGENLTTPFYYNVEIFLFAAITIFFTRILYKNWPVMKEQAVLGLSLILTSLGYVIVYGPLRIQRWDIFGVHFLLFSCLLIFSPKIKSKLLPSLFLGILALMGLYDFLFSPISIYAHPQQACKTKVYYGYYLKELKNMKERNYRSYLLPWSYLSIANYLPIHLPIKIEDVYFQSSRGNFYQLPSYSSINLNRLEVKRGVSKEFYTSPQRQKELRISSPEFKGPVYRSPYLKKGSSKCFTE